MLVQAAEISNDDFVLVGADWSIERAMELLERVGTRHAVIRRLDEGNVYHYIYRHSRLAQIADPQLSLTEGLGLQESEAAPIIDARRPVNRAIDVAEPVVIMSGKTVVGILVPDHQPQAVDQPRRGAGGSVRSGNHRPLARTGSLPLEPAPQVRRSADPVGPAQEVTQHLSAEHPERAVLEEEVSIVVSLSRDQLAADASVALNAEVGASLEVLLSTRSHVELAGPQQHTLTIADGPEIQHVQFKVKAIEIGSASLRILAFVDGRSVADLPLGLEVVAANTDAGSPTIRTEAEFEPVGHDDPDLTLLILEQVVPGGKPTMQFLLSGRDPDLQLNLSRFGEVTLQLNPDEYFAEYFRDIEGLLPPSNVSPAEVEWTMKTKGARLYEEIVPEELREKLWAIRDKISSVLIQSTDPWVPWEMCFLTGPDDEGTIIEHGFVCEKYDVARWVQGIGFQVDLSLEKLALVVTGDSNLPEALAERDSIMSLGDQDGVLVDQLPATPLAVYEALASGDYSAFHFTGHGSFTEGVNPDRSQIMLDDGTPFRAENLSGRAANLKKGRPVVFLNACQVGRGGMGLVDAGGWANAMLEAGAGAFVGAHWSVLDRAAAKFSETFYRRLLAGDSLAAATRHARLEIRSEGDPTWLAYITYAASGARLATSSP